MNHFLKNINFAVVQALLFTEMFHLSINLNGRDVLQEHLCLLKTFKFIKAVSDTVLDLINSVYQDKLLIFIKAVSDTVLDLINSVYHNKPLMFIRATYRESLVSHHRAVNEADSCLLNAECSIKAGSLTKESHFIGSCTNGRCETSKAPSSFVIFSYFKTFFGVAAPAAPPPPAVCFHAKLIHFSFCVTVSTQGWMLVK